MPLKGSKASQQKRKFIGQFQKNKKQINNFQNIIHEQEEQINSIKKNLVKSKLDQEEKVKNLKEEIVKNDKIADILDHRVRRKKAKIDKLKNEGSILTQKQSKHSRRIRAPSSEKLNLKAKYRRRKETFQECSVIHGGSDDNIEPTVYGMLDTLTAKCKADYLSSKILLSKTSIRRAIENRCSRKYRTKYYESAENVLRSLNVYYSHHVMGKRKYINVRKANNAPGIPNFVSYKVLADKIKEIPVGTLRDIHPDLTKDLSDDEIGVGKFRDLAQYAPRLAEFYLRVNETREDKLNFFEKFHCKNPSSKLFLIAIGGDEAPLAGTTFLLSFLNVGKRIASSFENFITFGGNVKENGEVVRRYVLKLVSELRYLENEVFEIHINGNVFMVEFKVESVPNDMKMLAFLAGELSNSAYYFTTFGNVNSGDCNEFQKKFNVDWKPFNYADRVQDAIKVAKKKEDLSKKKINQTTYRKHVTNYISKELESRQEEVPLMKSYIDFAKCEPLHLKNNTVKEMFMKLVKVVLLNSETRSVNYFKELPENNLLYFFIDFVRKQMNCNFLGKKLITWFNENKEGKGEKPFSFRFRGKESFNYLKFFPSLILVLKEKLTDRNSIHRIMCVFYQSLCLRKVVSYSVRIEEINLEDLDDMKQVARKLFVSCAKYDLNITPSLWTFSNIAPIHCEQLLTSVGYGLGINTMEGREQKHQMIHKYSMNSTYQDRWSSVFRHEYIQLVYLRENGFDVSKYRKRDVKYLPKVEEGYCSCSLQKFHGGCELCDSLVMKSILSDIEPLI